MKCTISFSVVTKLRNHHQYVIPEHSHGFKKISPFKPLRAAAFPMPGAEEQVWDTRRPFHTWFKMKRLQRPPGGHRCVCALGGARRKLYFLRW